MKFELELFNLRLQYQNQFVQIEDFSYKPDLYVTPKSKGLGVIGIAEMVISIFLSKEIKDRNGEAASLIQIAKAFEFVFNLNFGSIYDKQFEVFNRKSCNLTKALDFLKNTLVRNRKNNAQNNNKK